MFLSRRKFNKETARWSSLAWFKQGFSTLCDFQSDGGLFAVVFGIQLHLYLFIYLFSIFLLLLLLKKCFEKALKCFICMRLSQSSPPPLSLSISISVSTLYLSTCFSLSIYFPLSVYFFLCLSFSLYLFLYLSFSLYLFISLSIYLFLSICLILPPSLYLSVCLSLLFSSSLSHPSLLPIFAFPQIAVWKETEIQKNKKKIINLRKRRRR